MALITSSVFLKNYRLKMPRNTRREVCSRKPCISYSHYSHTGPSMATAMELNTSKISDRFTLFTPFQAHTATHEAAKCWCTTCSDKLLMTFLLTPPLPSAALLLLLAGNVLMAAIGLRGGGLSARPIPAPLLRLLDALETSVGFAASTWRHASMSVITNYPGAGHLHLCC